MDGWLDRKFSVMRRGCRIDWMRSAAGTATKRRSFIRVFLHDATSSAGYPHLPVV